MSQVESKDECPKHDTALFSLEKGGTLIVCINCKKILMSPRRVIISTDELNALVELVRGIRKRRENDSADGRLGKPRGGSTRV